MYLRHILSLFLLILSLFVSAQTNSQAYWSYIDRYKGWAIEQMQEYRIPASITLAQGLIESNAGRSRLATEANNHFGIKCGGTWNGPYIRVNDDAPNEKFRKYKNARESFVDHSKFLQGKRYQGLYQYRTTDYRSWAKGLKAAGYATNPAYAEMLIRIIESYNLSQFDSGKTQKSKKNIVPQAAFFDTHLIYENNGNYFIVVELGDDMATISKESGISLRKLYRYNDLPLDYAPTQGDIIYFKPKRGCASREFRKNPIHIVDQNQSLHDISQLYGMQLEKLYKLNHFEPDHTVQIGDIIRIR